MPWHLGLMPEKVCPSGWLFDRRVKMRFRRNHAVMSFLATALMASLLVGPISAQAASASSFQTMDIPSGWECEMAPKGFLDILGILNDVEYAQYSDRISTIS